MYIEADNCGYKQFAMKWAEISAKQMAKWKILTFSNDAPLKFGRWGIFSKLPNVSH